MREVSRIWTKGIWRNWTRKPITAGSSTWCNGIQTEQCFTQVAISEEVTGKNTKCKQWSGNYLIDTLQDSSLRNNCLASRCFHPHEYAFIQRNIKDLSWEHWEGRCEYPFSQIIQKRRKIWETRFQKTVVIFLIIFCLHPFYRLLLIITSFFIT